MTETPRYIIQEADNGELIIFDTLWHSEVVQLSESREKVQVIIDELNQLDADIDRAADRREDQYD